jgi:DNA-binding transcriptional regulator YhcF (GntR family)
MGYFLEPDAKRRVGEIRREEFFETTLEDIFSEMEMLGISIDRIVERWNARKDKKQNS